MNTIFLAVSWLWTTPCRSIFTIIRVEWCTSFPDESSMIFSPFLSHKSPSYFYPTCDFCLRCAQKKLWIVHLPVAERPKWGGSIPIQVAQSALLGKMEFYLFCLQIVFLLHLYWSKDCDNKCSWWSVHDFLSGELKTSATVSCIILFTGSFLGLFICLPDLTLQTTRISMYSLLIWVYYFSLVCTRRLSRSPRHARKRFWISHCISFGMEHTHTFC